MTSLHDELEKKLQDPNATPMFLPLEFLKTITCDFSIESELGRGGYGVVYKGVLRSGKVIAVKKLFEIRLKHEAFQNEVIYLMGIKHQNVVQFVGYCAESRWEAIEQPSGSGKHILAEIPKRLLCFEYVSNKSLDKHIADFGLSRIFGEEQSKIFTDNRAGTCGYMAPEYLTQGLISKKADIFSLGVIIIEIITGRKDYPYFQLDSPESIATSCQHFTEEVIGSWRYKFESTEKYKSTEMYNQQVKKCITMALKCVDPVMEKRPTVQDVIQVLNAAHQVIPGSSVLLDVYPLELRFHFEPNKLIACSLHLTNNTDEQVAFGLLKKRDEQTCFLSTLPLIGIVDPRTTYTLVVIMNKHDKLPQERKVDLILQTSGHSSDIERCKQHFNNEDLWNTAHKVTLKAVCALQGERVFQRSPIKIISMEDIHAQQGFGLESMDANQTEQLILTGDSLGYIHIWNYDTQKSMGCIKIRNNATVCSAKFIAHKGWFQVGSDDGFIDVYNYKKNLQKIATIKVYGSFSLAIHPAQSYVLSAHRAGINLWDWYKGWFGGIGWKHMQSFTVYPAIVCAAAFNPEDYNSFASAYFDGTIKVWSLDSPESKYTLSGHSGRVRSLNFFTRDSQQYLVTGSEDKTAKIWDMQKMECVHTLPHRSKVRSVLPHPKLPVLVTGTEDGQVYLWSSINFRLKRILNIGGLSEVKDLACLNESGRVVVAHQEGLSVIEISGEEEQGDSSGNKGISISSTD